MVVVSQQGGIFIHGATFPHRRAPNRGQAILYEKQDYFTHISKDLNESKLSPHNTCHFLHMQMSSIFHVQP